MGDENSQAGQGGNRRMCRVEDIEDCPEEGCERMQMDDGEERCVPSGMEDGDNTDGEDRPEMQERCMPVQTNNREPITTGIMLTMTIYTDQNCENMLEIDGDNDRRLMRRLLQEDGEGQGRGGRNGGGNGGNQGGNNGNNRGGDGENQGMDGGRDGENQQGGGRRTGGGQRAGGNDRQRGRFPSNPVQRMLPVVDDDMNTKCSMDSRLDQENGVFRKIVCDQPGKLTESVYSDAMCTDMVESDNDVTMDFMYDTCQPLPQRRQANNEGRRNAGRRRLADDENQRGWFERTACPEDEQDQSFDFTLESATDLLERLTCEETDDDDQSQVNPCEGNEDCENTDGCFLNNTGYCIWRDAPEGQGNFFVKYTWENIIVDGEDTGETFCPAVPESRFSNLTTIGGDDLDRSATAEQYEAWCRSVTDEAVCLLSGCKSFSARRGCRPQGNKIKCKKLCSPVDLADGSSATCTAEDKTAICNMYHDCNLNNKGKCSGKIRL